MNASGILASMCFPSVPGFCGELFLQQEDKAFSQVMTQAYRPVIGVVGGRYFQKTC